MSGVDQGHKMRNLLSAVEAAITTADPAHREALGVTIDAYARDFPEEFRWAISGRAPELLHQLLSAVYAACQSSEQRSIALRNRKATVLSTPAVPSDQRPRRGLQVGASSTASSEVRSVYGLPELW